MLVECGCQDIGYEVFGEFVECCIGDEQCVDFCCCVVVEDFVDIGD